MLTPASTGYEVSTGIGWSQEWFQKVASEICACEYGRSIMDLAIYVEAHLERFGSFVDFVYKG
jgi:hypothetical protein